MPATIGHIIEGGIAHETGLERGDIILNINEHPVKDVIDYMYYSKDCTIDLKIQRSNKTLSFKIKKKEKKDDIGFEIKPFRIKSCRNKCTFCFVNQLPKGMRKTHYI